MADARFFFVDEVHRWNRAQQDASSPGSINGTIILIGATTENPFFEVNKRSSAEPRFSAQGAHADDLSKAAARRLPTGAGIRPMEVSFADGALEHLVNTRRATREACLTHWNSP
jgi:putative ATPase